ncbi:MAG TPA: MFS transporter [Gaiellaceae bacterium]|nr:MFS transporter [Gaiellaceae bacterium]
MIARLAAPHARLLRCAPGFRLLFLAALASGIGTWLAFVALVIDVTDRTADARWVSALLIAEFLPIVVIGLAAAPLADRLPRRSILIAADLFRAAVFVTLPFAPTALAIVLLALAAGIATSVFRPAAYAGLPNLVPDNELPQANGLLQTADNLTWAIGALAGGALVAASGPDAAYWANAASFVFSALLLVRIRESLEEARRATQGHLSELAAGFALVVRSRPLLTVLVAWSIVMLASAAMSVAEVFLARDVFDGGDFGYGVLLAANALGLVVGGMAAGGLIARHGMRGPYGLAIALMGAGLLVAAGAPNLWIAALFVALAGAGNGAAVVCNVVLVQRGAPDRLRGRAFAVLMSTGYGVLGVGMVAAGPFTNEFGARAAWMVAAGLCALGAAVALALLGREESHERAGDPALAGRA